MKPSPFPAECEKIIADALRPIASELRLVDAADLISLLRFERHAELAELVSEAAELYFLPGTIRLGEGGEYHLEWRGEPKIVLDLELHAPGATVYLRLTLQDETGGIEINHIDFDQSSADRQADAAFLAEALGRAAFVPRSRPSRPEPAFGLAEGNSRAAAPQDEARENGGGLAPPPW